MSVKKSSFESVSDKLNHSTTVLLKKWAGLSGFYGYKAMSFEEVFALLNTNGYRVNIDDSAAPNRIIELYHTEQPKPQIDEADDAEEIEVKKPAEPTEKPVEKQIRKEKFAVDEAGRVFKV